MGVCYSGTVERINIGEVPKIESKDLAQSDVFTADATRHFTEYEMTLPFWRTDISFFIDAVIKSEIKDEEKRKGTGQTDIESLKEAFGEVAHWKDEFTEESTLWYFLTEVFVDEKSGLIDLNKLACFGILHCNDSTDTFKT